MLIYYKVTSHVNDRIITIPFTSVGFIEKLEFGQILITLINGTEIKTDDKNLEAVYD